LLPFFLPLFYNIVKLMNQYRKKYESTIPLCIIYEAFYIVNLNRFLSNFFNNFLTNKSCSVLSLLYDMISVLVNTVFFYHTAYTGQWIDITVSSYNRTGI